MFPPFRRRAGSTGLPRALGLSLCLGVLPLLLSGAEAGRVDFVLPAAAAEVSLETFAEQAAAQVVYLLDDVRGVVTQPVAGRFAPGEALDRMLAGTALKGKRDGGTGAFVVRLSRDPRMPTEASHSARSQPPPSMSLRNPFAFLATWLTLVVFSESPAPAAAASANGDVVQLSPFEVNTSRDIGYVASSTLAGTRFNTQLKDTPAALSIFTADFLEDIGVTTVKEAYEYGLNTSTTLSEVTGNPQQSSDLTFQIRGLNNASLGRNYFAWANNSDTYNTERLTFARGPNSVIFGIGGPGGIINTDTKRALFHRRRDLQVRVGSFDDRRVTLDLNEKLHDRLAVRVNLLWQDKDGWRDHEFERRRAVAFAGTWRPILRTVVRVDAESMRVDQNKPLNWNVFDGVTPWIAAGRPLSQTPGGGAVAGTTASTSPHNNYFVTNSASIERLNNTRITAAPAMPEAVTSITNTWVLRDFSIVPRQVWASGTGNSSYSHFDTVGAFVEHELFQNFFVEAAANVQHRRNIWARPLNWNELTLRADASAVLPDGRPNPYAGQYFIQGAMVQNSVPNVWHTDYRLTASYQFDSGRWVGRHHLAVLLSRREDENYTKQHMMLNVGNPLRPDDALHVNNRIFYRTYLSFTGPNPLNLPNHIGNPFTTPVNSGGVVSGLLRSGANNNLTRIDTRLVAAQSSWWRGRLITTLGLRHDQQDAYGSTPVLAPNRVVIGSTRVARPNSSDGTTRTFGAVFHLLPWLGIYYNNADNFTPQSGVAWGVDFQTRNTPQGNRLGKGEDIGLKFNLLGGRVIGTLGYYETAETNSNLAPLTRFNNGVTAIYSALRIPFTTVGGQDVTNFVSRGTELDLTANLTPNWRLQLNAQRSLSAQSDMWPWQTRFLEENLALFRANANVPVTANTESGATVAQQTAFLQAVLGEAKAVAQQGQLGHVRHSVNLFTHYSFREGLLRGLSAGLGVKFRGPQIAGLNAAQTLAWRGAHTLIDANLGYSRKLFGMTQPTRFQLNVANLFDNDRLIPTLSDGVIDYRWQYLRPRTISLTTTVKF